MISAQVRDHLQTLSFLVRPRALLGDYVASPSKEPARNADAAFAEFKTLYEAILPSRPFGFRKEIVTPMVNLSHVPEITPWEYTHLAQSDRGEKSIAITSPLKWVLHFAPYPPRRVMELVANREDMAHELLTREMDSPYYRERSANLSRVKVPLLSTANWGGQGLHLRGNMEGYIGAASEQKWLEAHGGSHWAPFYTDYGVNMQRKFFDHFLKGEDNGWDREPKVRLQVRHPGEKFVERHENEWPLARTRWTDFHLHPDSMSLSTTPYAGKPQVLTYEAMGDGLTFMSAPMAEPTEITGPSALKIHLSSATTDADVFAVLRVFDPQGTEVVFQGALDPHNPISLGWLRASHRKLDAARSLPYRPFHTHDELP